MNLKNLKIVFTELFHEDFGKAIRIILIELNSGLNLKGLVISVKDLFNVKGYKTRGGSIFLDPLPSLKDAHCMQFIKESWRPYYLVIQI